MTENELLEEIKNSGYFDEAYYYDFNPDVKAAKADPILHYLNHGAKESRNPSPRFNTSYYLRTNPDVAASDFNPLVHFILHGKREGRRPHKPKYFLTMAACIKNEGKYLDEWLGYYIYQGVEHFYLNNDGSTDNTYEVLKPYIKKGYVTLYEGLRGQNILQGAFYKKIIEEKRYETQWCCFFDADEFYQGAQNLLPFLKSLDKEISAVEIHWKFYGSNGLEKYDDRFVMERFSRHREITWKPKDFIKSICRLINTIPVDSVHIFQYERGKVVNAVLEDITQIPESIRVSGLPLIWENCWLNHYFFKSREEYLEKINKGDATNYRLKNDNFYAGGDRNDVVDDSMKVFVEPVKEIIKNIRDVSKQGDGLTATGLRGTALDPDMTEDEFQMLKKYLAKSKNYVEFGCGGSTLLAACLVQENIFSVESSYYWYQLVRNECLNFDAKLFPTLLPVDIGPTIQWGYPKDEGKKANWPNYYSLVWQMGGARDVDLCLIDGRFRVACFLSALINGGSETVILIHDFQRPEYQVVREYADVIEAVDNLYAFKRKAGADLSKIRQVLEEYKYVVD